MNTNTTRTRTRMIAGTTIAAAFAAIALGTAACGTQAAPQEIGTGSDRPANTSQRPPTSADSAERQGQRDSGPARDGYQGPPRPGLEKTGGF
jgi:Flp pilus assembly protein TadD